MSILNLNAPQGRAPSNKKSAKIWLGVGLLVAVLGIGTTFAASIVLNGGSNTESGQGVQSVVFCGGSSQTVTATPFSAYKNKYMSTGFNLTGIKVTGIPQACDDTDFIISVYPTAAWGDYASTTNALAVSGSGMTLANVLWFDRGTNKYPKVTNGSSLSSGCDANPYQSSTTSNRTVASSNVTNTGALLSVSRTTYSSGCTYAYISAISSDSGGSSSGNGSFTITFNSGNTLADSSNLSKIVVETQNDVLAGTALKPCSGSSTFDCTTTYAGTLGLSWATS
jgi:hypothetical protein